MLVEKVDPTWFPAERPRLQVGEVIDITVPDQLIKEGKVKEFKAPKIKTKDKK
jgi:hypothetical protein